MMQLTYVFVHSHAQAPHYQLCLVSVRHNDALHYTCQQAVVDQRKIEVLQQREKERSINRCTEKIEQARFVLIEPFSPSSRNLHKR